MAAKPWNDVESASAVTDKAENDILIGAADRLSVDTRLRLVPLTVEVLVPLTVELLGPFTVELLVPVTVVLLVPFTVELLVPFTVEVLTEVVPPVAPTVIVLLPDTQAFMSA